MLHSLEGKYRGRFRVSSTRFDGFSQPSAPTLSPLRKENAEVPTPTAPTRSPTFHPRFLQLDRSPLPARGVRSRLKSLGEVALLRAGGGLQSRRSQLLLRRASGGVVGHPFSPRTGSGSQRTGGPGPDCL